MKDYIIVGAGLAGISFAETLYLNNKRFIVVNDSSQNSSLVAAGIYNPVIVKRLSMPMNAASHMEFIKPFYRRIQERLQVVFDYEIPLYRRFSSVEEQNSWFEAADKPALAPFLHPQVIHFKYPFLSSPFGFGRVNHTGYIDTSTFAKAYIEFLKSIDSYIEDTFDYSKLAVFKDHVSYKGIDAKHIIFAEGYGIHRNPFFKNLPLNGTKGELLLIKAPDLKLDVAINGGIFILPLGNDLYKVGATYEWEDKTSIPTAAARKELTEKLEELISCDYEILEQYAGVRPTTRDRKPLIGTHPDHKSVHLLNGLGTRGVMLGPPMAKQLYDSIESGGQLDPEVNLERFLK